MDGKTTNVMKIVQTKRKSAEQFVVYLAESESKPLHGGRFAQFDPKPSCAIEQTLLHHLLPNARESKLLFGTKKPLLLFQLVKSQHVCFQFLS